MEDNNGLDMETDKGEGGQAQEEGAQAYVSSSVKGRVGMSNSAKSGSKSVDRVVLSASHPDLPVGAKQVGAAVHGEAGNPKGQGIL